MADHDNTSVGATVETPEITNQETLEQALRLEPVQAESKEEEVQKEEEEEVQLRPKDNAKIFGKYNSIEDAQKAYSSIQARATKAEQALKDMQKTLSQKSAEELKTKGYDEQVSYLLEQIQDLKSFKDEILNNIQSPEESEEPQSFVSDEEEINSFIAKNPLLAETEFGEEFKLIATHPSMSSYTLDSIYAKLKPKIEKNMGTKISVKERKLTSAKPEPTTDKFADVSNMSDAEYEKYKAEIFKGSGIKY